MAFATNEICRREKLTAFGASAVVVAGQDIVTGGAMRGFTDSARPSSAFQQKDAARYENR